MEQRSNVHRLNVESPTEGDDGVTSLRDVQPMKVKYSATQPSSTNAGEVPILHIPLAPTAQSFRATRAYYPSSGGRSSKAATQVELLFLHCIKGSALLENGGKELLMARTKANAVANIPGSMKDAQASASNACVQDRVSGVKGNGGRVNQEVVVVVAEEMNAEDERLVRGG